MGTALVDSSVLIGAVSARDTHHENAAAILHGVDRGELPTGFVTNYALTETLNFIHERVGHDTATGFLDRLIESAGFELVHAPERDFHTGRSLFRKHTSLAFGDATMVAYMKRSGIDHIYSFDDDFDAVDGIVRLNVATNPFD
ncbi:type II toxin-antitoxin system VapC family toxin [Natronobiforma cellulositropha]|uniref:type II toxin-antitoxin system VapC family toxin n=1 Tax=Natronobiforma cellulositropha TaxID=1679076 RepID=UPI0021D5D5D0|nr:PIN domain-containing protein [Natronobiforma cellulositropha]